MTVGYGNALTEHNYRSGITLGTQIQTYIHNFIGDGGEDGGDPSENMIVEISRPGTKRGDMVKIRFADINWGEKPKQRVNQIVGAEGTTPRYETEMQMRYQAFDGKIDNVPADQNNVSFDLKQGEIDRIMRQWAINQDGGWINQAVGYTPANDAATDYSTTGCNAVTALDSAHVFFAPDSSGVNANAAAVAAAADSVLTTDLLDDVLAQVTTKKITGGYGVMWPFAPCQTPWGRRYVLMCHPSGFKQLRENGTDSHFYDLSRADLEAGGVYLDNPLITGQGTIYNNTLILASNLLPHGITSDAAEGKTRMAALLGARAFHLMWGEGFAGADSHFGWIEHRVMRHLSMAADTVWGIKRTDVNGESWASAALVHYSHASDTV